jgi:DNA-binding MurR/RpiR family transcriptional regulator
VARTPNRRQSGATSIRDVALRAHVSPMTVSRDRQSGV